MSDSKAFEITPANTVTLRILWGAIVVGQIMIHAVFWYVRENAPEPLAEEVLYIFVGIGTALPLIAGFIARMVLRAGVQQRGLTGALGLPELFPAVMINLAIRESGAIFAAIALYLGASPVLWAIPASVALGATLVAYPSIPALRRLAQLGAPTRRLG